MWNQHYSQLVHFHIVTLHDKYQEALVKIWTGGRQWNIKKTHFFARKWMLFSLRNLFMKENQYEQAIGSQERYYVKISNFTLKNRHIDTKKKRKKNRLYLLKKHARKLWQISKFKWNCITRVIVGTMAGCERGCIVYNKLKSGIWVSLTLLMRFWGYI